MWAGRIRCSTSTPSSETTSRLSIRDLNRLVDGDIIGPRPSTARSYLTHSGGGFDPPGADVLSQVRQPAGHPCARCYRRASVALGAARQPLWPAAGCVRAGWWTGAQAQKTVRARRRLRRRRIAARLVFRPLYGLWWQSLAGCRSSGFGSVRCGVGAALSWRLSRPAVLPDHTTRSLTGMARQAASL